MNTLIDTLIDLIQTAISGGIIATGNPSTYDVYKGYSSMPDNMVRSVYITLDDAGERTEVIDSNVAQMRYYSIMLEFGIFVLDRVTALTDILDLSNQIKKVIESENTQLVISNLKDSSNESKYDNYCWGVSIVPFEASTEDNRFYRVRQVTIDFMALEDRRFEF